MWVRMSFGTCSPLSIDWILLLMQSLPIALTRLTASLYLAASRGCKYCQIKAHAVILSMYSVICMTVILYLSEDTCYVVNSLCLYYSMIHISLYKIYFISWSTNCIINTLGAHADKGSDSVTLLLLQLKIFIIHPLCKI